MCIQVQVFVFYIFSAEHNSDHFSGPVTYCNLGIGLKMLMLKIFATVL